MWSSKADTDHFKKQLFHELVQVVRLMAPGSRSISHILRHRIEKLTKVERQEIVNKTYEGCTPLFIACKRGLAEVAEYLCSQCGADLELKGLYEVPDDRSVHYVTPLWCASVAGKADVVKVLIAHGADINSVSDTGSTSVRSACFMTHVDIVKYLVEQGADIVRANFNGGTCLINSVQSAELCEFLLNHGAEINAQDIKCKTALHYAIEEDRYETVKLLIERGGDPYIKSRLNDDALQTACTKGAFQIFNYLLTVLKLTPDETANSYELLGSTFLDEYHDMPVAIQQWKTAALTRHTAGVTKKVMEPIRAFGYAKEFQNIKELDNALMDHDSIRIQSLLICQRVLGPTHKDTIFRLMFRGAAYADSSQYQKCIQLWLYALELRIRKDTILYNEVFFTSNALVKLFLDILQKISLAEATEIILFEDAFHALKLIGDEIEPSMKLLSVKPEYRKHQANFDLALSILIHFMYVALKVGNTQHEYDCLQSYVRRLIRLNPHTIEKEMTLLHLAVTTNNILHTTHMSLDNRQKSPFPNVEVSQLLLECGLPVNASMIDGSSALFLACHPRNYKKEVRLSCSLFGRNVHVGTSNALSCFEVVKHALCTVRDCAAIVDFLSPLMR